MVHDYLVTLRNTHRKLIDRFSFLVVGTSVLLFLAEYFQSADKRLFQVFGSVALIALLVLNLYLSRKLGKKVYYSYAMYLTALVWATMPQLQWLSIFFVIMGLIERQAKKDLEIGFSADIIIFHSIPRKTYRWNEFSNIVLRDNILTLDFADNRILQRETIDDDSDCEEDEFNDYCREKLATHHSARQQHNQVSNLPAS